MPEEPRSEIVHTGLQLNGHLQELGCVDGLSCFLSRQMMLQEFSRCETKGFQTLLASVSMLRHCR